MIDVYILGICLKSRCHAFLKVLPNFASRPESRNFDGCPLSWRKILLCRTCFSVRTVIGALVVGEKKKQQEITQWGDQLTFWIIDSFQTFHREAFWNSLVTHRGWCKIRQKVLVYHGILFSRRCDRKRWCHDRRRFRNMVSCDGPGRYGKDHDRKPN